MMRVPVSEKASFGWNALANPSVTRVEKKRVPTANRFPSVTIPGKGEPAQVTPLEEYVARRPGCAMPTVNWTLLTVMPAVPLNESDATIGCWGPLPAWFALARRLVTRRVTFPEAGSVKVMPLNTTALGAKGWALALAGTGPEPVSTVNNTSVKLLPASLLVTFTLRKTVRLLVRVAPGTPPEQSSTISPTLSVIPSERTSAATDVGLQNKPACE